MRAYLVAMALGLAAIVLATIFGGARDLLDAFASPPIIVRAALVAASVVVAVVLLARAVVALGGGAGDDARDDARDVASMIRGVRLAFLAVAAFAAAAGWFVGHPLLLVAALVIAGVDVVETTFLLIVARRHRPDEPSA